MMLELIKACKRLVGINTVDRTKFSLSDTKVMCNMWKTWQANQRLYKSQTEFAKAVNQELETSKSKTTIIRHIRKNL